MTKKFAQSPEELENFLELLKEDKENIRRVKTFCQKNNLDVEFLIHGKAETVEESAKNTGIDPAEIVKTLIFIGERPVAVLCPGDTSVSEEKLEGSLGEEVRMADPDEVKEASGYTIGGVSPFDLEIPILMEEDLMDKERLKPAAGSRVVGARIAPEELRDATGAEVVNVGR